MPFCAVSVSVEVLEARLLVITAPLEPLNLPSEGEKPARSSVPPLTASELAVLPRAVALPTTRVPPLIVFEPLKVLAPDSVRLPVPDFKSVTYPVPPVLSAKTVDASPDCPSIVYVPVFTTQMNVPLVIVPPAIVIVPVRETCRPPRSRTPPLTATGPAAAPRAALVLLAIRLPAFTVRPPVKEFDPESVNVPLPSFVRPTSPAPLLLIAPPKVEMPFTVVVSVAVPVALVVVITPTVPESGPTDTEYPPRFSVPLVTVSGAEPPPRADELPTSSVPAESVVVPE